MKLIVAVFLLFVSMAGKAQTPAQTITADTLISRLTCKTMDCINTCATNNKFVLKQKTNVGNGQSIYNSSQTFNTGDACTLPDELSAIMGTAAISDITYGTAVLPTYTNLLKEFTTKGFRITETFNEDDIVYTDYAATIADVDYTLTISSETKSVSGKKCPYFTFTIKYSY